MTNTTITEKIGRLLAQAEHTSHEAEAEIFFAKAQELATLYSVDLAKARHATELKERTVPTTRRVVLGERRTKGLNTLVELITEIGGANGLICDIAHNSTYVNLFGFEEDIDVTEALYASLSIQMVHAAEAHKRSGNWKTDLVYREGRYDERKSEWVSSGYKPVSWLTARLDFQQAFAVRVGARLKAVKRDAELALLLEESAAVEHVEASTSTALVLADKAKDVRDYYADASRARGSYRGGRNGYATNVSSSAGDSAGRSARLSGQGSLSGVMAALR